MKFWYHPKLDIYVPENPWWNTNEDNELVEVEINKEELILNGEFEKTLFHNGRWRISWSDKDFGHTILNKIPWPFGKYKITITPYIEDEHKSEIKDSRERLWKILMGNEPMPEPSDNVIEELSKVGESIIETIKKHNPDFKPEDLDLIGILREIRGK